MYTFKFQLSSLYTKMYPAVNQAVKKPKAICVHKLPVVDWGIERIAYTVGHKIFQYKSAGHYPMTKRAI